MLIKLPKILVETREEDQESTKQFEQPLVPFDVLPKSIPSLTNLVKDEDQPQPTQAPGQAMP